MTGEGTRKMTWEELFSAYVIRGQEIATLKKAILTAKGEDEGYTGKPRDDDGGTYLDKTQHFFPADNDAAKVTQITGTKLRKHIDKRIKEYVLAKNVVEAGHKDYFQGLINELCLILKWINEEDAANEGDTMNANWN